MVLDVLLPGLDGHEVCRTLRERERWVPVLMLTALGEVEDRIRGLDSGADDYLVKPFDFGELLARLRALIRRGPSERPAPSAGRASCEPIPLTRVVTWSGHETELTPREFDVLTFMMRRPGNWSRASSCWNRCGHRGTPARPTWSTYTSATCGASSSGPRSRV